jgi:hypothetical protein
MFPLPISTYIYAGLILIGISGIGYGRYEHNKYVAYKATVEALAATQAAKNESIAKQQMLINKGIENEYQAKLSALKSYYGGLRQPSSGSMSAIPQSTIGIDGKATNLELACAYTTQQLVSLQDWVKDQAGVK